MSKPVFDWKDPFLLDQQLSDEERMVRDTAHQFSRDVLLPRVVDGHVRRLSGVRDESSLLAGASKLADKPANMHHTNCH